MYLKGSYDLTLYFLLYYYIFTLKFQLLILLIKMYVKLVWWFPLNHFDWLASGKWSSDKYIIFNNYARRPNDKWSMPKCQMRIISGHSSRCCYTYFCAFFTSPIPRPTKSKGRAPGCLPCFPIPTSTPSFSPKPLTLCHHPFPPSFWRSQLSKGFQSCLCPALWCRPRVFDCVCVCGLEGCVCVSVVDTFFPPTVWSSFRWETKRDSAARIAKMFNR